MALTPDGSLGGLAVVEESTYGTTPGSPSWTWLHHINSTLVPKRQLIQPEWATYQGSTAREYSHTWAEGELQVAMSLEQDIVGPLLKCGSNFSTNVYTFGSGNAPDIESLSVLQNYGGGHATTAANYFEWIFAGFCPNQYRFNIVSDGNATMTVSGVAQSTTKTEAGSAATPSAAAESYIMMPSDVGSVTYGGSSTAITIQSADITVSLPKTGSERRGLGSTTIRQPVTSGRPVISFSVAVDLDASTGNDTIAILDDFVDGTALGNLVVGDFALSNCYLEGDPPSLSAGLMSYTLTGQAQALAITTEDNIT
jgi:hypothetical protein